MSPSNSQYSDIADALTYSTNTLVPTTPMYEEQKKATITFEAPVERRQAVCDWCDTDTTVFKARSGTDADICDRCVYALCRFLDSQKMQKQIEKVMESSKKSAPPKGIDYWNGPSVFGISSF